MWSRFSPLKRVLHELSRFFLSFILSYACTKCVCNLLVVSHLTITLFYVFFPLSTQFSHRGEDLAPQSVENSFFVPVSLS